MGKMTADEVSDLEARISSGHPLFGSRLKLTRAFHHVQHLREVFGGYIASEPIKVSGRTEASTGDFVYYVDHYESIDPYVSTLIGDIYHNIRAAFDYMASALVVSNDGVIDHRTCFPICTSAEKFQLDAARGLAGASIKAIAAVESLQPYISENNLQMQLIQKMNNFDKHRMIIPLVAGTKSIGFNPSDAFSDFFGEYVDLGWIHMTPRERQLPLNVGDRVFGIAKGARE
ncbi:MAG: hypothetical protein H0T41_10760, partial [Rhodobacteraceae bacterium]|nr:hypothetical protein [Paracoccaceae bacterium]